MTPSRETRNQNLAPLTVVLTLHTRFVSSIVPISFELHLFLAKTSIGQHCSHLQVPPLAPYRPNFIQFHRVFQKFVKTQWISSPLRDWRPFLRRLHLHPMAHSKETVNEYEFFTISNSDKCFRSDRSEGKLAFFVFVGMTY